MEKPEIIESYVPHSGHYSWRKDFRLNAWLAVATALYVAVLFLRKRHPEWSPLGRGLLMLVPLIPGLLYVRSWTRMIGRLDELQRRVQLEAFLFAALGTLLLELVLATLGENGVDLGGLDHGLGLGGTFAAMFVLRLFGWGLANHRYK